jgi:hypothetical protein
MGIADNSVICRGGGELLYNAHWDHHTVPSICDSLALSRLHPPLSPNLEKHTTCVGDIIPKPKFLKSRYNPYNTHTRVQTRTTVDLHYQVFPYGIPTIHSSPTVLTSHFLPVLSLLPQSLSESLASTGAFGIALMLVAMFLRAVVICFFGITTVSVRESLLDFQDISILLVLVHCTPYRVSYSHLNSSTVSQFL